MRKINQLLFSILGILIFWGCSSTQKTLEEQKPEVRYSLVYIIHADANYTYHMEGKRRQADLDVLNRAIETGQNAKHGEVLIFHQQPENKLLFLFPKKDRTFYHFRNGELIGGKSYSPKNSGLQAEAEIFNQTKSDVSGRSVFLYFGHEIPTDAPNLVYHQSQPNYRLTTEIFSNDLRMFDTHFDLAVLSTCNNGNPIMVDELTGITDYLVASPQNLHLSHLTDEPLHQLETTPDISTEELANNIAKASFDRLASSLQTMVTVAVYNLNETKDYIDSLANTYRNHLTDVYQTSLFVNNRDCATLPEFRNPIPNDGVTFYFKPPDFGRNSSANQHSGWGCKL